MSADPSAGSPVVIMAGSGELPALLADRLAAHGRPHRILAFEGFCERRIRARADSVVGLLDVRGILERLERWDTVDVTLAGGLARPSAAALVGAFSALRSREEVAAIVARGDDNLLRGAIGLLEDRGYRLIGLRDLAPELLAKPGRYGAHPADPGDAAAIRQAFAVLAALSPFDVGQAAVVRGERVLAIEGPEGTDRMLRRVRPPVLRRLFRSRAGDRGGVLAKGPKAGQDLRVDLPAIGPRTVTLAAAAGLSGIAITAGNAVVVDHAATVAAADRLGLFLLGHAPDA